MLSDYFHFLIIFFYLTLLSVDPSSLANVFFFYVADDSIMGYDIGSDSGSSIRTNALTVCLTVTYSRRVLMLLC